MCNACTPIFVSVAYPVSEIQLPSKTANFPFRTVDYSPWASKNLINRNRLKKFMQEGMDVTCMYIDFDGRGFSTVGDITTFKNSQISLSMVIKKFNRSESAQKIYARRDGCNMHVHRFWWVWSPHFRRYRYLQKWPNFSF